MSVTSEMAVLIRRSSTNVFMWSTMIGLLGLRRPGASPRQAYVRVRSAGGHGGSRTRAWHCHWHAAVHRSCTIASTSCTTVKCMQSERTCLLARSERQNMFGRWKRRAQPRPSKRPASRRFDCALIYISIRVRLVLRESCVDWCAEQSQPGPSPWQDCPAHSVVPTAPLRKRKAPWDSQHTYSFVWRVMPRRPNIGHET